MHHVCGDSRGYIQQPSKSETVSIFARRCGRCRRGCGVPMMCSSTSKEFVQNSCHRDPYEVFFSTKRMHERTVKLLRLQKGHPDLNKFILKSYRDIYEKYYTDKKLVQNTI